MRFGKRLIVVGWFGISLLLTTGCGGETEGQQIATDQELSDYGQKSAPDAFRRVFEQKKKQTEK